MEAHDGYRPSLRARAKILPAAAPTVGGRSRRISTHDAGRNSHVYPSSVNGGIIEDIPPQWSDVPTGNCYEGQRPLLRQHPSSADACAREASILSCTLTPAHASAVSRSVVAVISVFKTSAVAADNSSDCLAADRRSTGRRARAYC